MIDRRYLVRMNRRRLSSNTARGVLVHEADLVESAERKAESPAPGLTLFEHAPPGDSP